MTKKTKPTHRKAAASSGRALGTGSDTAQENEHAKTTSASEKASKTVDPLCQDGNQDGASSTGNRANNVVTSVGATALEGQVQWPVFQVQVLPKAGRVTVSGSASPAVSVSAAVPVHPDQVGGSVETPKILSARAACGSAAQILNWMSVCPVVFVFDRKRKKCLPVRHAEALPKF